ncbi:MAG: histidine kinase dimerization/phospho-acceptor domain-containing protein [Thermomicrobiales bacterium]
MGGPRDRLARLPIRLRLTVWYGVLLAAVLVLFGAGLWVGLRIRLAGAFDDQLHDQAALTLATVQVHGSAIALDPAQSAAVRRSGSFVRLLDRDGRVVADTSPALGMVPLDANDVAAALAGETRLSSVRVRDRSIRIITAPVSPSGAVAGAVQVGLPLSEIDEVMHELLVAILVAAPAAAVVALVGGYLLARRALEPVAVISRMAAGIGGGNDLHARLGLDLPDDELGQLAATFDGMLGRIEAAFERQRRFTGDAAHELRTPLALMRGRIDLARSRPRTSEEHLATLDGLDGDLGRLSGVVGALLVLARSDAGRLAVEREAFDLAVTVGRVADQYAEMAAAVGATTRSSPTRRCGRASSRISTPCCRNSTIKSWPASSGRTNSSSSTAPTRPTPTSTVWISWSSAFAWSSGRRRTVGSSAPRSATPGSIGSCWRRGTSSLRTGWARAPCPRRTSTRRSSAST